MRKILERRTDITATLRAKMSRIEARER